MLLDDRPDYPMTFLVRVRIVGELKHDVFHAAVESALERHPMLRARLDRSGASHGSWVLDGEAGIPVDWRQGDAPLECPDGQAIDLERAPGVRLWVRKDADTSVLTCQFHHACCDGIGGFQFLGDLLAGYGRMSSAGPHAPDLPATDWSRLPLRSRLWASLPSLAHRFALAGRCLWFLFRLCVLESPTPLSGSSAVATLPGSRTELPHFLTEFVGPGALQHLRRAAQRRGATINDWLVRDLFLTLAEWNRRDPSQGRRGWLRVLMPVSMRGKGDGCMPAANCMSYVPLIRRRDDCVDERAEALLAGLRDEGRTAIRSGLGQVFLGALDLLLASRALPAMLAGERCFATAVLTNLGDPTHRFTARFPRRDGRVVAGELQVDEITGITPLRPLTRASFAVGTYAGDLGVCLWADPRSFTPGDARRLLSAYTQRIRDSIRSAIC
jgi:hypothetical protein